MVSLHSHLREASEGIKKAYAAEGNLRSKNENLKVSKRIVEGSYVRVLRGSFENAAYLRKHGHGVPWKFRYKVLKVTPHAVLLEIPTDGSVPRISPWQLLRKCEPALEVEVSPSPDDPKLTEFGVPLPGVMIGDDVHAEDDDTAFDIQRILRAEKVKNRWRLWIKWKGFTEATPMWRTDLVSQSCNEERGAVK